MDTISKATLQALLKNGKNIAFETLYRLYFDKLVHIGSNYLGRKENAEEVVQNVFLKLWNRIESIDQIDNLNGYLFTVTRNYCLDVLKHEKVKLKYIEEKRMHINKQYASNNTASLTLENELRKRISEGIELLPKKCKRIFIKSRIDGLTSEEIANLFQISKSTVNNHISNGIRHMRIHLKEFTAIFLLFFS